MSVQPLLEVVTEIIKFNNESVIIAGDLNVSMDENDRVCYEQPVFVQTLQLFLEDWSLVDIWRELNPLSNRRTFFWKQEIILLELFIFLYHRIYAG